MSCRHAQLAYTLILFYARTDSINFALKSQCVSVYNFSYLWIRSIIWAQCFSARLIILDRSILLVRSNNSSLSVSSIVSTISSNSRLSYIIWLHFSQISLFSHFVTPAKIFCTKHPPPLAVCAPARAEILQEGTHQETAQRAVKRNICKSKKFLGKWAYLPC